ncbi:MAG: PBP1A family penicillin-binding protein [Patescibacteria group bacterium]
MPIPQLRPKSRFSKSWRQNKISPIYSNDKNRQPKRSPRQPLKHRIARQWLPVILVALLMVVLTSIAVFAWFSKDLPNPDQVIDRTVAQSTRIYARDGTTLLYEVHGDQKRTLIELEDIPDSAINATIAIEDKDFYSHKGFSLWAIFRTLVTNVLQGKTAGGSTITQQFVKNAILTTEKSIARKVKELVLSYQLERKFSKEQILKLYFNEIPYGSTNYGIEAAAQSYFGKSARDLTLDESALLAALPQAPTYYSPRGSHTDILVGRQQYILDQMAEQGYISEEEAAEAKTVDIMDKIVARSEAIIAPHFVFYVREYLTEQYGEAVVEHEGLKVITTLEPNLQRYAEQAIANHMEKNESAYGATNASLVSTNPHTGQILAMVGSRDYFNTEIDGNVNVALRPRQPGSSFKPMVYATAFKNGFTPETILFDLVTKFSTDAKTYEPKNYDLGERGPVTIRQALAGSLNIPAVKALYLAGVNNVLDFAENIGYTTFGDRSRFGLSLVLGGGEVKLLEHTNAFATLAAEGVYRPVSAILRIEDINEKVLEEWQPTEREAFDKTIARQINSILSDDGARAYVFGSGSKLTLPGRPVAAKTGTTDDYRDAWTMGYTPSLAAGVWVGNNDNSEMRRGAAGAVVAAPIWNDYMRSATEGAPVEYFNSPPTNNAMKAMLRGALEGEEPLKVDSVTGKLIPSECLADYPEEFIAEKTFREVHTILHYVDPSDPDGPVPQNPGDDPQYNGWEEPVRRWAEGQGYTETKPGYESCDLRSVKNQPTVSITSPDKNATINSDNYIFTATASGKYNINKVEFYIDNQLIVVDSHSPYSQSYTFHGLANGFHELKVVATDKIGNTGQSTIKFNLLISYSSATTYLISPVANSKLVMADKPFTIKAFAADPVGISSVGLIVDNVTIDSVSSPDGQIVSFDWSPKNPGDYSLSVKVKNNKNNTTNSKVTTVEVTD